MKTITIKGGVFLDMSPVTYGGKPEYRFLTGMSKSWGDYTLVIPHEFDIEIPADFDPRQEQIGALEKKRTEARAAFQATMTEIDRQISQLLAIENSAEAA